MGPDGPAWPNPTWHARPSVPMPPRHGLDMESVRPFWCLDRKWGAQLGDIFWSEDLWTGMRRLAVDGLIIPVLFLHFLLFTPQISISRIVGCLKEIECRLFL